MNSGSALPACVFHCGFQCTRDAAGVDDISSSWLVGTTWKCFDAEPVVGNLSQVHRRSSACADMLSGMFGVVMRALPDEKFAGQYAHQPGPHMLQFHAAFSFISAFMRS